MDSYPLRYVYIDPVTVLSNVIRHVSVDALGSRSFDIVAETSWEVGQGRGESVLNMLRALLEGKNRSEVSNLFKDEIDALCWQVLASELSSVPSLVQVIARSGAGPYAAPDAMEFCSRVLWTAKLGVPHIDSVRDMPSVWARMFVGELMPANRTNWPSPEKGYVGLYARQEPHGNWNTAVVYSVGDYESPAVRANHYWLRSSEIVQVLLMRNEQGEYWAYVTRGQELPDGGNVMRVYPNNAEYLISLGMDVYPMNHHNPYEGYIRWDKSDVLKTDPMPPMPESIDRIRDIWGLMDRSGWITDAESWVKLVGNPLTDQDDSMGTREMPRILKDRGSPPPSPEAQGGGCLIAALGMAAVVAAAIAVPIIVFF